MHSAQLIEAQILTEDQIDFTLKTTRLFDSFRDQLNESQLQILRRMLDEGQKGFETGMGAKKYMSFLVATNATATAAFKI